jgi:DNA repair exonuclease SbcCD ATPase subunit
MSTHNKFAGLNEPDHETKECKRKVKKKIREINILEKKPNKTSEELDKISKKDEYIAMANPVQVETPHIPNKMKKEFKQKEKNWKNTEKKLKEKIKTKEQNELDLKKKIQELNYNNARLKNELKQLKENKIQLNNTQQDNQVEEIIQKEYEKKKKEYSGNKDKAFRQLSRMYHPDKLEKIIGNKLATHLSQIANSLKT